ncbi:MAG: monovalent cation:H+ antiporter-2, family [Actinomycetota bacterium]|nr:monovalent cation:H+ antiporter-2, family [Actinomycetota bacterium]
MLAAVGIAARLAAARGVDPFPVPLLVGLLVSAAGPLHALRPAAGITRVGAGIAVVVLLFCLGLDHGAADRRTAAATLPAGLVLAVDAALNFVPGAVFGLLAGFGLIGGVLLGGVTAGSSWAVASATLDRQGRFGNRETPAALAVLVMEHAAVAVYLPLAAALLVPGGTSARLTALLGSAAAIAAAAWLALGPPPTLPSGLVARLRPGGPPGHLPRTLPGGRRGLLAGPPSGVSLGLILAGTALAVAGVAAALGVAAAGIAYLAGAALASHEAWADLPGVRPAVAALRDLSAAAAALALGLLVPGAKLAGAVAGGAVLAATTGATKVLTGWWAAGRLRVPGPSAAIGRAGRVRAGLILVPRGELALTVGILAALAGPGRGPGTGLAALAAVEVVLTGAAARGLHLPPRSNDAGRPGWYRWTVPTPAAARPEPPGAG